MIESPKTSGLSASPFWPYLAAAAVLTDFAAEKLKPIGEGKPNLAKVGAMCMEHGESIRMGPAKGRWSLSNTSRRAALAELKRQNKLIESLHANDGPDKPDNPTQRAIDALLMGKPPSPRGRPLTDLLGLERAIDLLGPAVETQQDLRLQVLAQIERLLLTEPLQRLVTDGFFGRTDELRKLRSYVDELPSLSLRERLQRGVENIFDIFRTRPPLVIHGLGGVGKSTLLAKFLLDHAGPEQPKPIPFIYLDFDRGQLDPSQPDTILQEAFRQIKVQFPELAKPAESLETKTERRIAIEDKEDISKSTHYAMSGQLRRDLIKLLQDISASNERNVLLCLDTFEVVQRRGSTPVFNVLKFAAELQRDMPRLRFVIAGRTALRDTDFPFTNKAPRWQSIRLEGFDMESGRAYLEGRLMRLGVSDVPSRALDRIVSLVQGNPLSLRLAAQVFAKEGMTALENAVDQARFDAVFTQERVQGMLHNRIVANLPEPLQKIADPGLIVRRINPDVIARVLAGPCQLDLKDPGEADQLFENLKMEVALVEPLGRLMLRHRPDVRLLMLPLLRHKIGEQAPRIDEAAVAFWKEHEDSEARAEEIYHLLWLGADNSALEESWARGPVAKLSLEEALDEFEVLDGSPAARIWLSRKLGHEVSPELEANAGLMDWERNAELRARNLLASGAVEEALKTLRARKDRTPTSPLWLIELEALKLLGKDKEALQIVDRALKVAESAHSPAHIFALLLQKASLLERLDRLEKALVSISKADELSHALANAPLAFESGLTRTRILRKLGRNEEEKALRQQLSSMLNVPATLEALRERPALLLEASAEIGDLRPELLITAAQQLGTEDSDSDAEVSTLIGLGVAYANRGDYSRAIELLERSLSKAKTNSDIASQGMALFHLGNVYRILGHTRRAIECYEESLAIAKQLGSRTLEVRTLGNLGAAYTDLGDLNRAIKLIEESLAIARSVNDLDDIGNAIGNLAHVYWKIGDFERAIELFGEHLTITRQLDDRRGEMQTLTNLSTCYSSLGDHHRAIELYMVSLKMAQELGDIRHEANILINIGSMHIELGEFKRAIGYCERAIAISQKVGDRTIEARAFGNLGVIHSKLGEIEKAGEYYSRQLKITREVGDRLGEGSAQYNLALSLEQSGNRSSAVAVMHRAADILEEVGSSMTKHAKAWLAGSGGLETLNVKTQVIEGGSEALRKLRDAARLLVDKHLKQVLK